MERYVFDDFEKHTAAYHATYVLEDDMVNSTLIFEAREKRTGMVYAVKSSKIQFSKNASGEWDLDIGTSNMLFESRFALLANHPNILKVKEVIVGESHLFMIMPKYLCTLDKLLMNQKLSPKKKTEFIFQLVSGVYYMHSNGFVHCDIKPQNILVDGELNNIVLCDFGLSSYAEDVSPNKAFQSLAYRAPEHISPKDMLLKYYRESNVQEMNRCIDYRLSELWSVGLICLEILYNTHGIAFCKSIERSKLLPKNSEPMEYTYEKFINLIALLHSPEKYENISRFTPYTLLKHLFGRVISELDPLIKMICECFLPLEINKRSIHSFLYSSFFVSKQFINERIAYIYPDVISMYVPAQNGDISKKNMGILIEWLFSISDEYRLYPIVVLNAVDYVIQRTDVLHYFNVGIHNYQLFGACVLWIMTRLVNFDFFISLSQLKELCCNEYCLEEFKQMIQKILAHEKGLFYFDCVYNYIPSEELMIKAIAIVSNIEEYLLYPNPKRLALSLLETEKVGDICKRTPKQFREYNYFQKEKEEADSYLNKLSSSS